MVLAKVGGIEREEPGLPIPSRPMHHCREDEKGRREERKKTESGIGEVAAEREKPKGRHINPHQTTQSVRRKARRGSRKES